MPALLSQGHRVPRRLASRRHPLDRLARDPRSALASLRTKLFAEEEALAENGHGLEVVSVNPTLLLGPGDTNGSSTKDVWVFLDRTVPAVPRGGTSFLDARDAAERAKRELGWEPRDAMDTLADTVNDLRGRPVVEAPGKKRRSRLSSIG